MTERHLAATFGRVGATDADRSAALETLFTIWMRTLYSADPWSTGGAGSAGLKPSPPVE
jgi:hypothetical protein